jgi:hypothetical protein
MNGEIAPSVSSVKAEALMKKRLEAELYANRSLVKFQRVLFWNSCHVIQITVVACFRAHVDHIYVSRVTDNICCCTIHSSLRHKALLMEIGPTGNTRKWVIEWGTVYRYV